MTLWCPIAQLVPMSMLTKLFGGAPDPHAEDVINSREVIKEGWLNKQSRNVKEWRKRYVVLTKDCLATFKTGPLEMYMMRDATECVFFGSMMTVKSAEQETQKENSFCLQRNKDGRFFFFIADTPAEKEAWVGAIGRQMVRKTVLIEDHDD